MSSGLKVIEVTLSSEVPRTFRTQKAAQSLDIDIEKKSTHHLRIEGVDLESPWNLGLVVGASGSGKTTLARKVWDETPELLIDEKVALIEAFPRGYAYEDCATALTAVGLNSVPCWIRPIRTLSNGQRARAKLALNLAHHRGLIVEDEWTSVVDRTVAKVMSHAIQKSLRKAGRQAVLLSCHYDVIDWLNPDWIMDCNTATFTCRRKMVPTHERQDRLRFDVREVSKHTWGAFKKYHYLSEVLPKGRIYSYGLFQGENQVGYVCYAAYIIGDQETFFFNRLVIHPDYCGFGLGLSLVKASADHMLKEARAKRILGKFSSIPMKKACESSESFRLLKEDLQLLKGTVGKTSGSGKAQAIRNKVRTWTFCYLP
jgi:ABC-type dipeptide/oligopeptide/nickel transport system ATPase subunit